VKYGDVLTALGLSLNGEQQQALDVFAELLRERAVPAGFVAASDLPRLEERHVLDSLRAGQAFTPSDATAYDLGSGAGLPGIPLAVAIPGCRFVLCEPHRLRAAFLELAVERLGLRNVDVRAGRAEELPPGADVITARAFAPLARAWDATRDLLRPGGRLVYFAGAGLEDPEGEARRLAGDEAEVTLTGLLATSPPLVMMTRT